MGITWAARSTSMPPARTPVGVPRRKHAIQDRQYGSIRTDAWSQSCVEIDATLVSEQLNCALNTCLCLSVPPTFASVFLLINFRCLACGRGPANVCAWPTRGAAGKHCAICGWKHAGRCQKNNPKHPKTQFSCEIWVSVFIPDLSVLGFLVVVKIFEISQ